jgi:hypothetical protein
MTTVDPYNTGYAPLLDKLSDRLGLRGFEIFNSGGSCLITETRLEGNVWLWITDWDAGIHPLHTRTRMEANGITIGYNVSLYPADPDNDAWCDSCTVLASIRHQTAKAEQLPQLVQLALRALPRNTHHTFDDHGQHRVDYRVHRL